MRPFYRKDLFRDEIIKIMPKELTVKIEQGNKKLSILKMEKGQSMVLNSNEYEVGVVFLSGTATVTAGEFKAEDKGSRKDPFSGQPTAIYIPRNTEYTITATGYGLLEIALCMAKTDKDSQPFIIEDAEITRSSKGVFTWKREVNEILTKENAKHTCGLEIGEIFGCPGVWATYPYQEDNKETVYLFKFSPNPGKRVQVMRDASDEQLYYVGHDEVIVLDQAYLPMSDIEDSKVYCLWFKC